MAPPAPLAHLWGDSHTAPRSSQGGLPAHLSASRPSSSLHVPLARISQGFMVGFAAGFLDSPVGEPEKVPPKELARLQPSWSHPRGRGSQKVPPVQQQARRCVSSTCPWGRGLKGALLMASRKAGLGDGAPWVFRSSLATTEPSPQKMQPKGRTGARGGSFKTPELQKPP